MTDDPDEKSQQADSEEAEEVDAAGAAATAGLFGLSDQGLGQQWFIVGDDEVKETFGTGTFDGLESGRTRWAARFSGDGLDGSSADPLITSKLLRRVAITARWISNGLFPGRGQMPGFVLGEATHSIVLEFTLAPDESPVRVKTFAQAEDEDQEARSLYPTVEGGRYFASLLDSADHPDQFVERLGHVGRRAVLTYQGALEEMSEFAVELDLLVPAIGEQGEQVRRRVNFPPEKGERELVVLNRKPEEESQTFEVEGLLYAQNSLNLGFGIQRDNEDHVTGEYDLRVADKLGPAWNKRVWAKVEEIGPREDWMPRAGRTRRVLLDVVVLREGETRLEGTEKRRVRAG